MKHMQACCVFFSPSHAACAPDVDVVGVLDQDETWWYSFNQLENIHCPQTSTSCFSSFPADRNFYWLNTFLASRNDVEVRIVTLSKTEKQLLRRVVRCFKTDTQQQGRSAGCAVTHRCSVSVQGQSCSIPSAAGKDTLCASSSKEGKEKTIQLAIIGALVFNS